MNINVLIADFFLKNDLSKIGLMNGKMGQVVFLYETYHITKIEGYKCKADRMIDEILSVLPFQSNRLNFGSGLAGVVWGFEYLMQKKYYVGDVDDLLADCDDNIYNFLNTDQVFELNIENGLIGYLSYLMIKLKNKQDHLILEINTRLFKLVLNKIISNIHSIVNSTTKDAKFDLLSPFPFLLNCFNNMLIRDLCTQKLLNTLEYWTIYLSNYYPNLQSNRLYFALLLYNLNRHLKKPEIDAVIKNMMYSVDIHKIADSEVEINSLNIRYNWIGLVKVLHVLKQTMNQEYPNYKQILCLKNKLIASYYQYTKNRILYKMNNNDGISDEFAMELMSIYMTKLLML